MVFKNAAAPGLPLGEKAMLLQGFPMAAVSDLVAKTSHEVLQDIAANMLSCPVMLILIMSAVLPSSS